MEATILLGDGDVVDAGLSASHQPVFVELPQFIAIGPMPLPSNIVPFVLETHRNAISAERPQLLDQAVVEFLFPLPA